MGQEKYLLPLHYFLFCPGEYTDYMSDTMPSALVDTQLRIGLVRLGHATVFDARLNLARAIFITFTTQKNCVEDEVIKMGLSEDLHVCVIKAVMCIVCHLRSHNAHPTTHLVRIFTDTRQRTQSITPTLISATLQDTVT